MGKMGIRKVPLAAGILAGIGLFVVCVMQVMAGVINMAVIFGVAAVAVMELGVMASVIHGRPALTPSVDGVLSSSLKNLNIGSKQAEFVTVGNDSSSATGFFVAPQPSMGHMDLRMDTASNSRENTGIYIESEELMRGGRLQQLVYGTNSSAKKIAKKPKKAAATKPASKRVAKPIKVKAKSK
jgi:hypothetical protein